MPKKFDRCVRKVRKSLKERGRKGNPFAICRAAMKKGGKNMPKVNVKPHLRKVKGRKAKVRVRGHRRKK